jgi:hypothetical protein
MAVVATKRRTPETTLRTPLLDTKPPPNPATVYDTMTERLVKNSASDYRRNTLLVPL